MPKALTAENGAKALLMGEFHETVIMQCESCEGDGHFDDEPCFDCDGAGDYALEVTIEWTTIKEIYAMYVKYVENKLAKEDTK